MHPRASCPIIAFRGPLREPHCRKRLTAVESDMLSHEATTSPANRTRWDRLLPAAVLFVALAARLMLLGSKSLWADEAYAAGLAGLPFLEAVRLFPGGTPHPGGGMAIIWLSTRLFGPGESGLRALIAVISASASVPLFLFLKRRSGSWGAACAALCWALCPWYLRQKRRRKVVPSRSAKRFR